MVAKTPDEYKIASWPAQLAIASNARGRHLKTIDVDLLITDRAGLIVGSQ